MEQVYFRVAWFAGCRAGVLILLSDFMLRVSALIVGVHQLTCILLCLGLASIAVGLGATMPNFRETSPSKIAAGFGGTLNLVLSALYIIVIVVLTALPCHFYLIAGRRLGTTRSSTRRSCGCGCGAAAAWRWWWAWRPLCCRCDGACGRFVGWNLFELTAGRDCGWSELLGILLRLAWLLPIAVQPVGKNFPTPWAA